MVINTFSQFNYGHFVTSENNVIPLNEGFGEMAIFVRTGSYTLQGYVIALSAALNSNTVLNYIVTVNRLNNRITISANGNFSLLFGTSLNTDISIKSMAGFDSADYTLSNSYTSSFRSGSTYFPQFKLQNFFDFDMIKRANAPTVRTSATGAVEVVKYSNNNFMKCNVTFITNITGQGVIKNNAQGVDDAIAFMDYATEKRSIEFVYDVVNPNNFVECLLESTAQSREGVDFELQPLYSRGLTGYYELPSLEFRRL